MKLAALALLVQMFLVSCAKAPHQFSTFGAVTSVTVLVDAPDGSERVSNISDPNEISRLVMFVDARRANWTQPWYGIPVPGVRAEFFDGDRFKGSFGVGVNFFEAHRDGDFYSKSASPTEIREFRTLLAVDDESPRTRTN